MSLYCGAIIERSKNIVLFIEAGEKGGESRGNNFPWTSPITFPEINHFKAESGV